MWRCFEAVGTGRVDRALTAVLSVAVVVRVVGIRFGFPHPDCRPDEGAIGSVASRFYRGDLNPQLFNYPAFFMLAVAICLVLWLRTGWALGFLKDRGAMDEMLTAGHVHGLARLLSVAAGVSTVAGVYRISLRLFDRRTAITAAVLMALAFLPVRDSHFGVTDTTASLLALLAVGRTLQFEDTRRWRDAVLAAGLVGLATSTKYNTAVAALPLVLAIGLDGRQRVGIRVTRAAMVVALMLIVFLAISPFSVIEWRAFVTAFRGEMAHLAAGHGPTFGRGWVVHATVTFRYGLGIPMCAAAVIGLVHLTMARPRTALILTSYPIAYYLLLGSGQTVFVRYMLPVVPFIVIAAAYGAVTVMEWLATCLRKPDWSAALTMAVTAVMLMPAVSSVFVFDRLIARTDNRVIAASWIELRFPHGARIAQFGPPSSHVRVGAGDRVREARYPTVELLDPDGPPDVVVVPSSGLWRTSGMARPHDFPERDYEVAADFRVDGEDPRNVYDWQDEFYVPLAGFYGITRPGPNLRVFVRRDEPKP